MARPKRTKRRRRFTDEEKQTAVRYLREQRANEGRSWRSVSEELGISETILRRWCEQYPESTKPEFHAVEIVSPRRSKPVVIAPRGVRVEGLSVEEIAVLLQTLSV